MEIAPAAIRSRWPGTREMSISRTCFARVLRSRFLVSSCRHFCPVSSTTAGMSETPVLPRPSAHLDLTEAGREFRKIISRFVYISLLICLSIIFRGNNSGVA